MNGDDKKSFENLFKESYKGLYLHALSFVREEEDAKDIVNDVFEYVWDHYDRIDFSVPVNPLLYKLVRNRSLDFLRHEKTVERFRAYQSCFSPEQADDYKEYEELIEKVMSLIESMPTQTRTVFMKCFVEKKKYKEVGEELNISVNTVRTHISKALRILRDRFSDDQILILALIFKKNIKKSVWGITHF